jgi:hypothetical protein
MLLLVQIQHMLQHQHQLCTNKELRTLRLTPLPWADSKLKVKQSCTLCSYIHSPLLSFHFPFVLQLSQSNRQMGLKVNRLILTLSLLLFIILI